MYVYIEWMDIYFIWLFQNNFFWEYNIFCNGYFLFLHPGFMIVFSVLNVY